MKCKRSSNINMSRSFMSRVHLTLIYLYKVSLLILALIKGEKIAILLTSSRKFQDVNFPKRKRKIPKKCVRELQVYLSVVNIDWKSKESRIALDHDSSLSKIINAAFVECLQQRSLPLDGSRASVAVDLVVRDLTINVCKSSLTVLS